MCVRSKLVLRARLGGLGLGALVLALTGCPTKTTDLPPADGRSPLTSGGEEPKNADLTCGLKIISAPPTEILVDGKAVGTSPVTVEHIGCGAHDVTFVDEENGNVTLPVELQTGEFQEVHQNLPPKATEGAKGGKAK